MLSLDLVRSIHADRQRAIERATRDRRLLAESEVHPVVDGHRSPAVRADRQPACLPGAATVAGPTA